MNLAEAKLSLGASSPVFDAPPVVETALAFRFAPIDGFGLVHFGQLLDVYGTYSRCEVKPPIDVDLQQFISAIPDFVTNINLPLRSWYISQDGSELVQIQNNLFVRNWRATEEKKEYRHYAGIRPLFIRDWETFCKFLDDHGMKRPSVWQWEVTYINHLLRGREWRAFTDIPALFPVWRGIEPDGVLGQIEAATFTANFRLPDGDGRIQFSLQPGVREDGTEILQLTVMATGKPDSQDDHSLLDWLDYGHLAVVNGFVQFVSKQALNMWGHK